jgi:GxxExxY protein
VNFGFTQRRKGRKKNTMSENELSRITLDVAFQIHKELWPGLFESVYEAIMSYELIHQHQLNVYRQRPIPVVWKGVKLELGFRSDLIIEEKLIVEIKFIDALAPVHAKQLLTHLRLTNIKLGLLINFNEELLKNGIRRIVNNL